jgi:hypothetical protein
MFTQKVNNQTHTRTFGGILNTTGLSKEQRNFEKKHLKAYKNGWQTFPFGFQNESGTNLRIQKHHKTK